MALYIKVNYARQNCESQILIRLRYVPSSLHYYAVKEEISEFRDPVRIFRAFMTKWKKKGVLCEQARLFPPFVHW